MAKEKWYRTGAVAEATGISQYRLRCLAKANLIESRSNNGMLYIPASEMERLKANGPPPMPARAVDAAPEQDDRDEPEETEPEVIVTKQTAPRARLTEELYAAPSRQLARSKEKVIRLEHTLEAKRLQQQSREIDRVAKEEQTRERQQRAEKEWREGYIRRVLENVPGELVAPTCAAVEEFLDRVPPGTNLLAKVDEIIYRALSPVRRCQNQTRAVEKAISLLRLRARRTVIRSGAQRTASSP